MPYKDPEKRKANAKQYLARPEVKARVKQYRLDNLERDRLKHREYESRPEVKARRAEYWRKHQALGEKYPSQDPVRVSEFNKAYRKTHIERHNEQNRKSWNKMKNDKEWLSKHNERGYNWKVNNPQKWRSMQLKSQTKYLKSLEPFLNKEYNHIPYLYKVWADEVKQNGHTVCGITDCFETNTQSHHIFQKKFYPKLSLNLNNGIPLCIVHHNEVHGRCL